MATFTSLQGDIFSSSAQALVNPVNCVGVMGAGLAKQFRDRYPTMFSLYRTHCRQGIVTTGQVRLYSVHHGRTVINLPTKVHWQDLSNLDHIRAGLKALAQALETDAIPSVAVPPVGCGLGGLNWRDVRPIVLSTLDLPGISVQLWEPPGFPIPRS